MSDTRKERYVVDVDDNGCDHCSASKTWTVVDVTEGCAIGQSFGEEEAAQDLCEYMNQGYAAGVSEQQSRIAALTEEVRVLKGGS